MHKNMKRLLMFVLTLCMATSGFAQKIMPMGDSFTERNDPGYRGYLWNKLKDNGFSNIHFVGTGKAAPPNIYAGGDPNHEGHSGATIGPDKSQWGNLYSTIPNAMSQNPDIILLIIGVNDLFNRVAGDGVDIATMNVRLSNLLDYIYSYNANVKILVSNLPPLQFAINGGYANFDKYIKAIPGIVQQKQNEGRNCYFVDMNKETGYTLSDFNKDNVHPSASGYQKIANVWYNHLAPLLPGTNVPVTGVSITPATASVFIYATTQLSPVFAPANASNQSVTWISGDTAVATVSPTGLVTGKAIGTATITVTTVDGNKTATSAITVTAPAGPLKVHCIGNSLTQAEPGYRGVLKNKLAADGYTFSFVGTKTDGTCNHSGYGGYIVGPGASKVGNIYDIWTAGPNLNGVDCDIIILEIGINDYFNATEANYNPESPAAAKLDGLISLIYSTKPDVAIYVSNLTPVAWDTNAFGPWNAQVPVIVKKYADLGKKCFLADVRNGISWDLSTDISSDQLHPTAAGYTKMGNYYASLFESTNTVGVIKNRELQNGTLKVYPNPVTGNMLNLAVSKIANHETTNISLFDFSGNLIKNVKLQSGFDSENNIALNLENVNSGFYMLQVQSGTNVFSSKIIKR